MKNKYKWIIFALVLIFVVLMVLVSLPKFRHQIDNIAFNKLSKKLSETSFSFSERDLLKFIETSKPLMEALEKYYKEHGKYPPSISVLYPKYLKEIQEGKFNGWMYFGSEYSGNKEGDEMFAISHNGITRDSSISYDSKDNLWRYNRGDGSRPDEFSYDCASGKIEKIADTAPQLKKDKADKTDSSLLPAPSDKSK